jgi:diguanylate cyclase (GGDEF)-like protein
VVLSLGARDDEITPLLALAVLPLLWVALRQDLIVAAAGVLVLNILIATTAALELGAGAELVELQVVMLAGALAAYYVASLVHTTTEAIADLNESEGRYRLLTDATPDLVIRLSLEGTVTAHNEPPWPHGATAWARAVRDRLAVDWLQRVAELDEATPAGRPELHEELVFDAMAVARLADEAGQTAPPTGSYRPGAGRSAEQDARAPVQLDVRVLPELSADGTLRGVVAVATDRTNERAVTAQLAWEQHHDQLTGLANAAALEQRLASDVARTDPEEGHAAVALVDLDGFRLVNHTRGREVGDQLLRDVAHHLRRAARPGDLTARLSGDAFAVALWLAPGQRPEAAVRPLLRAVREAAVPGEDHGPTASIGLAVAADAATTPAELLRDADTAMNVAKESGRARLVVFDSSQRAEVLGRQATVSGLQRAIAAEELVVHFQPVVSLDSGVTTSVEALVRWASPEGLRYPDAFIGLAEEVGLDVPLGSRVLDLAVAEMASWHRNGSPDLGVSVNVTARQLATPGFAAEVLSTCARHGFDPSHLWLELTETSVMGDPERSIAVMEELRAEGVGVALDDFGTGYSSIAYLQQLPVDVLKIDRAFVSGLPDDDEARAIVALVVGLSAAMGIAVTAEGVETDEQRRCLLELGCHAGQGYLFARPEDPSSLVGRMPVPAAIERVGSGPPERTADRS